MLSDLMERLVGITQMGTLVYPIKGGAPEDEGGADDEGTEDADEGEEETDEEDDYTPPTKAELEKMKLALSKANKEAAQRRHWLDAAGIDPRTGNPYVNDDDDEQEVPKPGPARKRKAADDDADDTPAGVDPAEVARMQKQWKIDQKRGAQREARLVSALGKTAAQAALAEAGWNGKGANLIERMIDLSNIEVDDSGEIIGLAEQIADVKTDMPEWFKQARQKRQRPAGSSADVDGADKGSVKPPAEPVGWLQRLENQFQGIDE